MATRVHETTEFKNGEWTHHIKTVTNYVVEHAKQVDWRAKLLIIFYIAFVLFMWAVSWWFDGRDALHRFAQTPSYENATYEIKVQVAANGIHTHIWPRLWESIILPYSVGVNVVPRMIVWYYGI